MKHAVYCGSKEIYGDMVTSAKSLVANSDVDRVWFLVESEFPYELPEYVTCIDVSGQEWFAKDGPNMGSRYTYLAMMRAVLCHVLPDVDKVLSLDADTICLGDVSAIWDIDLDGCYFAAAKEAHRSYMELAYTNTGVCLYNLEMLRDGKADEVARVLDSTRYTWLEQDVMNYLCQGRIADMDGNFNACDWTEHDAPSIVHFAGHSDWRSRPEVELYKDMTWEQARARKPRVLVAVPLADKADPSVFKAIFDLGKKHRFGFDYVRGYGTAKARNDIARKAVNGGYTHVLMVDSDTLVKLDSLEHMLEPPCDVVLGCYPRSCTRTGESELFKDAGDDFTDTYSFAEIAEIDGRFQVKGGGLGCALIDTRVFRGVPFPWFEYVEYENGTVLSEDLYFCDKASEHGFRIEADSRVRCGHIWADARWE